ncbi:hypothetical protein SAMN05428957_104184 [Oryzisolibacter propanilivorax]|uniref:Uncharacterized protein n=1 Tax=Oryzisolibacter propanilivorax TaxID=1527607 RepID=A0A1G9S911_9BURK|nr:hypothetical protein [Oryzisolibacter propanilivorax]SDM31820.1 hypothetical protein SAMN05428957_104184 [Oryzisolibacter propanilivorax]
MPAFWNTLLLRRALPGRAQPEPDGLQAPVRACPATLDLDARTDWPTHRIRSFLSMQAAQQGRSER